MLGFGLGLNKWRRVGGYVGLLDLFPNAAAAYSLRKLRAAYSGAAVRVRRSSDNTEQDIGFDANEDLDTTALTTFVNSDVNQYTSDFSVNDNGWAAATDGGTAAGNIDGIGGQDDVLRFTVDTSTTSNHRLENTTIIEGGYAYTIEFDYYIPSTNANLDSFRVQNSGGSSSFFTDTDTWASGSFSNTNGSGGYLRFQTSDGGTVNYTGNGTDVFYMKNIVVTQTTADGLVTTWYDQSLSNNATQTVAADQPKIVSAGSLVTENGKAAIDFDGVDDNLQNATLITNTTHTIVTAFVDVETRTLRYFYDGGGSVAQMMLGTAGNEDEYRYSSGGTGNFSTLSGTFADPIDILSFAVHGTTSQIAINGALNLSGESKANPTAGKFNIGESAANSLNSAVKFWEIIVFASDQSANRTGIETNINNFYSIY